MVKKMVLVVCGLFFFGSFTPVISFEGDHRDADPEMETMRKDKVEFIAKLDKLIEKYNATTAVKKDAVKKVIRNLISSNLNKDVAFKKALIAKNKKR